MSIKANKLNEAIINKLTSVLENTDYIDRVNIHIAGSRGEVPTITYQITEFITPPEDNDNET